MSARVTTAIAFKLFALYLCVQAILQIPSIWSMYGRLGLLKSTEGAMAPSPYLVACVFTFVGFIMVFIIYRLGSSVLKAMPNSSSSTFEAIKLEIVLFQLLGVYFVVTSLTYLPNNILMSLFSDMYNHSSASLLGLRLTTAAMLIKLAFGLALIVKAPAWQELFYKLRVAGTSPHKKSKKSEP